MFCFVSEIYSLSLSMHPLELAVEFILTFYHGGVSGVTWQWPYCSMFEFFFLQCSVSLPPPPQSYLVIKAGGGGESDEFLTNAFSLCTQMAIWFSSFDLLMWWIILIEFLILNSPGRSPFCSWQFSLHTSWVHFAVFCVCVCWSDLEFWFECVLSVTF